MLISQVTENRNCVDVHLPLHQLGLSDVSLFVLALARDRWIRREDFR